MHLKVNKGNDYDMSSFHWPQQEVAAAIEA